MEELCSCMLLALCMKFSNNPPSLNFPLLQMEILNTSYFNIEYPLYPEQYQGDEKLLDNCKSNH